MEPQEKQSLSDIWGATLSEIRGNWKCARDTFHKEWKQQLSDRDSVVKRLVNPAAMPETRKAQVNAIINDARAITDSSFNAVRKLLKGFH